MQEVTALKQLITAWTGLDHGTLYVLASLVLSIIAALGWRRPLSHPLPWLSVLAIALIDELSAGSADGIYQPWEVAQSEHDLILVMILPTALFLVARFAPQIIVSRIDRQFIVPLRNKPRFEVIEGEFEEVRKARQQSR